MRWKQNVYLLGGKVLGGFDKLGQEYFPYVILDGGRTLHLPATYRVTIARESVVEHWKQKEAR